MRYEFIRFLAMGEYEVIFSVYARDEHSAMLEYMKSFSLNSYDMLSINGEWV